MRVFLRRYAVGCLLIFVVSCQTKIAPISPVAEQGMPSLVTLLSLLEARQSGIRDIKAFVRTKVSGDSLNQTFRQALFVQGNETIRVETYNLFRQVLGVIVYKGGKTSMYDPGANRIVRGEEVWKIMRRVTGNQLDFRQYISVFSGGIPRLSHLQAKVLKWNADQTTYQIETVDQETGEQVNVEIDAYTLLPKSVFLLRGTQEIYRVYWDDYRKVDQWDFPHKLVIKFKAKNEVIKVIYSDLFINQGFAPDVFDFALGLFN